MQYSSSDTSFDYLVKEINDKIRGYSAAVIDGKLDIHEYKRLCGVIQGLNFSKSLIEDLANKLEQV